MFAKGHLIIGLAVLPLLIGCQPPRSSNNSVNRTGRLARGIGATPAFAPGGGQTAQGNRAYGRVTSVAGDQAFQQELYYLTAPAFQGATAGDQLGYVSGQPNQATGVAFFGSASNSGGGINGMNYGSSNFDRNSMLLQLEIYDDRTGQQASDGSTIQPLIIRISPDQPTFVDAGGSMSGSQVNLYFQDTFGVIYLNGSINGQYFTGNISYADSFTYNQQRTLGTFSVPTCGFFNCY